MRLALTVVVLVAAAHPAAADVAAITGNTRLESFSHAKRLALELWARHPESFYCGCAFSPAREPALASCDYRSPSGSPRALRIEWEHVVPAHAFGQSFVAWREGAPACVDRRGKPFKGRSCSRKSSHAFRRMEADLYNLVPAIGEVNARRQNFSMAMIPGEARSFGGCDLEIEGRKVEPRPAIRGDVARIYLYMNAAYPGRGVVSRKNRALFTAWDAADPVDAWECERARRIAELQGNENLFVERSCRARDASSGRAAAE